MVLLEFKEQLKRIYGRYYTVINMVTKFGLSLLVFTLLNQNLGFNTRVKSTLVVLFLAALCSFLPYGMIAVVAAGVMLAHIYSVSLELALIALVLVIMICLLYYGFHPRDSYWLLLTPIACMFNIPYVIPLLVGLSSGIVSIIPVSCGVVIYYLIYYVKQNAGVLTNDAAVDITQKFVQIIRAFLSNQTMMVMIAAFAAGVLVVYLIRCMSIDYAWILAIVIGAATQLVVIFVGGYMYNISIGMGELIIGIIISLLIAAVYHFVVFAVDYSRTEYLQYEDDDYVYYVKAVPKITVTAADVKVQRINPDKGDR